VTSWTKISSLPYEALLADLIPPRGYTLSSRMSIFRRARGSPHPDKVLEIADYLLLTVLIRTRESKGYTYFD